MSRTSHTVSAHPEALGASARNDPACHTHRTRRPRIAAAIFSGAQRLAFFANHRLLEAALRRAHVLVMSTALSHPWHRMTVAEFLQWEPDDHPGARWQLRDGEPEMMAPASDRHGSIQSRLVQSIGVHLDATRPGCRVVTAPGVVPALRPEDNCLVPDIGVTCQPPTGAHLLAEPLVLIEVLSPTNVSRTRANVRAYRTIPSVQEIVVVRSTAVAAEVLRRAPDGSWPDEPERVGPEGTLRLDSIGFTVDLRDVYRTSGLV